MAGSLKSEHREVAKGTFWGIAGSLGLKFIAFIYTILLARLFAPEDIGVFNLGIGIMYSIAMFSDLGLNQAFSRYVPFYLGKKDNDKAKALLDISYIYSGAFTLIAALLLFLISGQVAEFFAMPQLESTIGMLSLFLVFNNLFMLNTAFLTSIKLIKESNLLNNIQNILKLTLTLLAWWALGPTSFSIAFGFSVSYILAATISFFWLWGGMKAKLGETAPVDKKDKDAILAETLPFGLMLTLVISFWTLATNLDKMMIGYMLPESVASQQLGIYSIALSLAAITIIFPGAITSIFLPVLSEMHGEGRKKESHDVSVSAHRWITFLVAPLTILMVVFPGELLSMFFGSAYAAGATALALLAIGMFVRSLSYVHGTMLASLRIIKVEIAASVLALAVNALLNLILIPSFGIDGSALASAISFLAVTLLLAYYAKKLAGFELSADAIKPIMVALGVLALFWLLHTQFTSVLDSVTIPSIGDGLIQVVAQKLFKLAMLGLMFLLVGAVYAMALAATGCFKKDDRELFGAILTKGRIPKRYISVAQSLMGVRDV